MSRQKMESKDSFRMPARPVGLVCERVRRKEQNGRQMSNEVKVNCTSKKSSDSAAVSDLKQNP